MNGDDRVPAESESAVGDVDAFASVFVADGVVEVLPSLRRSNDRSTVRFLNVLAALNRGRVLVVGCGVGRCDISASQPSPAQIRLLV